MVELLLFLCFAFCVAQQEPILSISISSNPLVRDLGPYTATLNFTSFVPYQGVDLNITFPADFTVSVVPPQCFNLASSRTYLCCSSWNFTSSPDPSLCPWFPQSSSFTFSFVPGGPDRVVSFSSGFGSMQYMTGFSAWVALAESSTSVALVTRADLGVAISGPFEAVAGTYMFVNISVTSSSATPAVTATWLLNFLPTQFEFSSLAPVRPTLSVGPGQGRFHCNFGFFSYFVFVVSNTENVQVQTPLIYTVELFVNPEAVGSARLNFSISSQAQDLNPMNNVALWGNRSKVGTF